MVAPGRRSGSGRPPPRLVALDGGGALGVGFDRPPGLEERPGGTDRLPGGMVSPGLYGLFAGFDGLAVGTCWGSIRGVPRAGGATGGEGSEVRRSNIRGVAGLVGGGGTDAFFDLPGPCVDNPRMVTSAVLRRSMAKRNKRRRLDAPEPLDQVLERAGENRFAKRQLPIPLANWRAAVGPRIADRTRPIALDRDVLVVKVATSVWANELSMLAPELIAKLASHGFIVKSLKFRVGPLDVAEGIPQRKNYRQVPPPAALAPELERSLADVPDEDLRSMIEKAARANLAWQDFNAVPRAAPAPPGAGKESAPPGRTEEGSAGAAPRKPGGGSDRRR